MGYRYLPGSETIASSDELPRMLQVEEKIDLNVYDDKQAPNPTKGVLGNNPTIGYGFNLRLAADMALVLNQIQFNGTNVFTAAAGLGITAAQVVTEFTSLVNEYPSPLYNNINELQAALSFALQQYFPGQTGQNNFAITSTQATAILNQFVDGYSVPDSSALSVYAQLSSALTTDGVTSLPPDNSSEAVALGSLYFNSHMLIDNPIVTALEDNNLAQAWYQIRYQLNGGSNKPGTAKRRFYESQVFGLSSTTDTTAQAYQNFEVLQEHRSTILTYESLYGQVPGSAPSTNDEIEAANRDYTLSMTATSPVLEAVQTLEQIYAPDAQTLAAAINSLYAGIAPIVGVTDVTSGQFVVLSTNIVVAPDVSDIANGFAGTNYNYNVEAPDIFSGDEIIVGPDTEDATKPATTLSGSLNGDTLLLAGAGAEVLYAGLNGNDTLVGGQGLFTSTLPGAAAGNVTLDGGIGVDVFDLVLSSSESVVETINPGLPFTQNQGSVYLSDGAGGSTLLGGGASASSRLKPESSSPAGTLLFSATGTTAGIQYSLDKTDDVLTISDTDPLSEGGMGGNSIVINDFDTLAAASSTGFLGIFLSLSGQTFGGATAGVDPPIVPLVQGGSESFTYTGDASQQTAETVTYTLSGAAASDFEVSTTSGIDEIGANGTFQLTIPAGASGASFTLIDVTPDNGKSDIAAGATLQLAASLPNPVEDLPPIQAAPVTFTYTPTPWNTDALTTPGDNITGVPNGGGTGVTLFTGDSSNDNVLATDPKNTILEQNSGNDSIVASSGTNSIVGGQGNDIVVGGGGTDIILMGNGNSEIYGGSKTNLTTALADSAGATGTGVQGDLIAVKDGSNTVVGGNGNDLITTGSGHDVVVLGPGNNTFLGGEELTAAQSNWNTTFTTPTPDQSGLVTTNNVTTSLEPYTNPDLQPYNGLFIQGTADAPGLSNANDTVLGGNGNNVIALGTGNNYVELGSGNDYVFGGMGNDEIIAGGGADYIRGGGGTTYITGGAGADTLAGGDGNNVIIGGSGNSTLISATGPTATWSGENLEQNYVSGGTGNDAIFGSGGLDTLVAGTGNTTINGGTGNEDIFGGSGNDVLLGGTGTDTINAGSGNTSVQVQGSPVSAATVYGGTGADTIRGGSGFNTIYAGDGGTASKPTLVYASESDILAQTTIYGGAGVQLLQGGAGSTVIYGGSGGTAGSPTSILGFGAGDDTFYGGEGTDQIVGGSGTNVLYAGDGGTLVAPTTVDGGTGLSTLYGGSGVSVLQDTVTGEDLLESENGDDTLIGIGADTLVAGTGTDQLQVDSGSVTADVNSGFGNDVFYSYGGTENLQFGTGIELSDMSAAVTTDSAGNGYLELDADGGSISLENALMGGLGTIDFADTGAVTEQTLLQDALVDDQVVSRGNDNFYVSILNGDSIAGGLYNDTIASWGDNSTVSGGTNLYGDNIYSGGSAALIASGTGKDTIVSSGSNATITGGIFGDKITVSGANSLVTSTAGADSITGSGAADTLIGGAGNSTFFVNNGSVVVQAGAGGGTDSIIASVSYSAPANINSLTLTGSADISATGNGGADTLVAGAGSDTLAAAGGVAMLVGGTGNTTFLVDNTADHVIDSVTGAADVIESSVSFTLPTNVNSLVLTGTANLTAAANSGADTLVSNSGVDTLVGGSGNDTFVVSNPGDVIVPGSGTGTVIYEYSTDYTLPSGVTSLTLSGSADVAVTANAGNDTLVANAGLDTFYGGAGNDTFVTSNPGDVVVDSSAGSTNVLQSNVSYTLPSDVNSLVLLGTSALVGTGNTATNLITANSGSDTLVAGSGIATLVGGAGNDTFVIDNSADIVQDTAATATNSIQSSVSYSLVPNVNSLTLLGTAALDGTANSAADTLVSNTGADTLVGGAGPDTFVINNVADLIQDTAGGVINIVDSSVSYSLPANINAIVLMGTAAIVATANGANDSLAGGAGLDTLIAGAGLDTLVAGVGVTALEAGSGSDLFVVNNSGDVVSVSGAHGNDTVESSSSYTLPSGVTTLVLTGSDALAGTAVSGNNALAANSGSDTLSAGSGNDTLLSGSGPTTLLGGTGTDTFVVNSTADVIASLSGISGATVNSSISYTLPTGITALVLTGDEALVGVGNASSDAITANGGNDTLIAGAGAVLLTGGMGADVFVINSASDSVADPDAPIKAGVDTIESSVSYTLPTAVNDLILTGTSALAAMGNANADSIIGNAGADTLTAGDGNDTLVAGAGAATLIGGGGNDTFVVNSASDVIEDTASGAINVLISSASFTLPVNIDTLLLGGTGALLATANSGADSMVGNGGADTLVAGSGNDTLQAGVGVDTFVAGSGPATFIVDNSADVIQGVSAGPAYTVLASSSFSLPTYVNVLTVIGDGSVAATANSAADSLTAGEGTDTLVAGAGADTLVGGVGNTTFVVNSSADIVQDSTTTTNNTLLSSVSYTAPLNVNTLILTGTGSIQATANNGSDTIGDNGATDTLVGGTGNDTFLVSNTADVVEDSASSASNTIMASVSFSLVGDVNTLVLSGTSALEGMSNSAADTLVSNSGADTLVGGAGNDTFVVNSGADQVIDTSASATNSIVASVNFTLPTDVNVLTLAGSSNLIAVGNAANDVITANTGNDTLVAGSGAATLIGGIGADLFLLNNTQDTVTESISGTGSTIQSSVSYSLPGNVNDLVLTGTANLSASANANADTLMSNSGIDTLIGGAGADVFVINNPADVILNANSHDIVESNVSYSLGTGLNQLELLGTAALTATGGTTSATLTANSGADTLVAGSAVTTMVGAAGNDTFVVNNTADVVTDTNYQSSNTVVSSVNYSLPPNVDSLILTGTTALTAIGNSDWDNAITANSAGGVITGTAANNTLTGGSGGTVALYGGSGSDLLVTGAGFDYVYAGSGNETVNGAAGTNVIEGGTGTNLIYGGAGTEEISGGGGDNLIYAGSGGTVGEPLVIYGNLDGSNTETQSTIYAGSGVDQINGGSDSDLIYGGSGTATLSAGSGLDSIYGTDGSVIEDTLGGSDLLSAGAGAETVTGIDSDVLVAGTGTDLMRFTSGSGASGTYEINAGFGQVTIGSGTTSVDNLVFETGLAPADFTVTAVQTGHSGNIDNDTSLVLTDGASVLNIAGGLLPGVVGSIDFADSGPISLAQLVEDGTGLGTSVVSIDSDQILFSTNSDQALVNSDSLGGVFAFGANDTLTTLPPEASTAYLYGNDDVIDSTDVWVGGTGSTVNISSPISGNETLAGAADTLNALPGGAATTITVYDASDVVNIETGAGGDSLSSYVSYTLPVGAQSLALAAASIVGTSNSSGGEIQALKNFDTLIGGSGTDYLDALGTNDVLVGGSGAETYVVNSATDSIQLGTGSASLNSILAGFGYTLPTGVNSLTLAANSSVGVGNSENDLLTSWGTGDTLVAGTGSDTLQSILSSSDVNTLIGGSGNDTFNIDNSSDVVVDSVTTTSNTLITSASFTLPTNVNTAVLTGFGTITGNVANDSIAASGASDTLVAGSGNDTLMTSGSAGVMIAGAGSDVLEDQAGGATVVLNSGFNNDLIVPGTGDVIRFGSGITSDSLTFTAVPGTAGAAPALVITGAGESATVQGGVSPGLISQVQFSGSGPYTLAEVLVPGADQTIAGASGNLILSATNNDSITGGSGSDTIIAWGSNDTLNAGSGGTVIDAAGGGEIATGGAATDTLAADGTNDTLVGGVGNENLVVNNTSAVIDVSAGVGHDTVYSSVAYSVPANVTIFDVIGTAGVGTTANSGNDLITGNSGADWFEDGGGADTFVGGAGNNTFYINNTADVVQVSASTGANAVISSVSYTLPSNVNSLTLTGSANLTATGNSGNDFMEGNDGSDVLAAGSGNDVLMAYYNPSVMLGVDTLIGGSGNDSLFAGNNYFDSLVSGTGVDTLVAGQSNTIVINNSADVLNLSYSTLGPNDTIQSSVSYQIATGVAQGSEGFNADITWNLTGSSGIVANAGLNEGYFTITGNAGADTLIGGTTSNDLVAGSGIDTLIAGAGATNVFTVNNAADVIVDSGGASDAVYALVNYTLPTNVNKLYAKSAGVAGTGNSNNDYLEADGGNDTLVAGSGTDTLLTTTGVNTLVGGSGSDQFDIREGDTVVLGSGFGPSQVSAGGGTGTPTIRFGSGVAGGSLTVSAVLDSASDPALAISNGTNSVTLDGALSGQTYQFNFNGTGNLTLAQFLAQVNVSTSSVAGASGNVILDGSPSTSVAGGTGNDTIYAAGMADTLTGGSGAQVLEALGANDSIVGGSENDTLTGLGANDTLVAGTAIDTLIGGTGASVAFVVNSTSDVLQLQTSPGSDTVVASANFSLPTNINTLVLAGTASLKGTANNGADTLTSNSGSDTLVGGSGSDTFVVNNSGDVVQDTSTSATNVLQAGFSYSLPTDVNTLILTGTAAVTGTANGATDTLTANSGADTLVGGAGNDTFILSTSADLVQDTFTSTHNAIEAGFNYSLPTNINALILTGTAALSGTANSGTDTLTANTGADTLFGGSGNDTFVVTSTSDVIQDTSTTATNTILSSVSYTLPTNVNAIALTGTANLVATANDGNDTLTTNSGVDTLVGGTGNDTFVVSNTGDVVVDTSATAANQVSSSISFTLPTDVNALVLTGTAALQGTANSGSDTLTANSGADTLVGGSGNDIFIISNSASAVVDTFTSTSNTLRSSVGYTLPTNVNTLVLTGTAALKASANSGNDSITANTGADTLVAGSGTDTLVSGTSGADSLVGGAGNDAFFVNNTSDLVSDTFTTSVNSIVSSVSYTLPSNVNTLQFTGTAALRGVANGGNDSLVANTGADTLVAGTGADTLVSGTAGADSLVGGTGNDVFFVNNTAVHVTDTSATAINAIDSTVAFSLPTDVNTLILLGTGALTGKGNAAADSIVANSGSDTLTAGTGVATLTGGAGADQFAIDNTGDVVVDTFTGTSSTLSSTVSYALPTNVNALIFTGTTALKGTANSGSDTLTANTGADTLVGGSGSDTFVIDSTANVVSDTFTGTSNTLSSNVTYSLPTNVNTLILTGTAALKGTANSGNDTLTANTGADTLVGGGGSDTFVISSTADKVTDTFATTSNTLSSSVAYTLPTNVNTLILTGTAALKGSANSGNDSLSANSGADTLVAGSGVDTLIAGATGTGSLVGGSGNDTFLVNDTADIVTDTFATTTNSLVASVSYTLPTNVNVMVLTGTAPLTGTGNSHADTITGNGGADTLIAGAGVATLIGGTGTDTFVVDNTADVVTVTASGTSDSVLSSVNYVVPANLEYLTLSGTTALTATGNSLTDLIIGNTGNDTLTGGSGIAVLEGGRTAGSDVLSATGNQAALIAGAGSSSLTGGSYKDFYAAGEVSDTITTGATANVIAVNSGDGETTIQPTTSSSNILSLGAGIDTEALTFTKSGSNLILNDGVSGDSITLTNWYAGGSDQDVTTLQVVEAASSFYDSSGSDGLRNQPLEDFNFSTLVSAFNTAGSPANWALSNDMASAQITSSGTQAYGGDLAYYFGLNGNLTGLELSAAQSTLTNGVFATGQQTIDSWSSVSGGEGLQLLIAKPPVSQSNVAAPSSDTTEAANMLGVPLTNAVEPSEESGTALPMKRLPDQGLHPLIARPAVSPSEVLLRPLLTSTAVTAMDPSTEPLTNTVGFSDAPSAPLPTKRVPDLGLHRGQVGPQSLIGAGNFVTPIALSWAVVEHSAGIGAAGGALVEFEHEEEGMALLYAGSSAFRQRPSIERGPLDSRRSA